MATAATSQAIELSLYDLLALIQHQAQIVAQAAADVGLGRVGPERLAAATLRLNELVNHFTKRLVEAQEQAPSNDQTAVK